MSIEEQIANFYQEKLKKNKALIIDTVSKYFDEKDYEYVVSAVNHLGIFWYIKRSDLELSLKTSTILEDKKVIDYLLKKLDYEGMDTYIIGTNNEALRASAIGEPVGSIPVFGAANFPNFYYIYSLLIYIKFLKTKAKNLKDLELKLDCKNKEEDEAVKSYYELLLADFVVDIINVLKSKGENLLDNSSTLGVPFVDIAPKNKPVQTNDQKKLYDYSELLLTPLKSIKKVGTENFINMALCVTNENVDIDYDKLFEKMQENKKKFGKKTAKEEINASSIETLFNYLEDGYDVKVTLKELNDKIISYVFRVKLGKMIIEKHTMYYDASAYIEDSKRNLVRNRCANVYQLKKETIDNNMLNIPLVYIVYYLLMGNIKITKMQFKSQDIDREIISTMYDYIFSLDDIDMNSLNTLTNGEKKNVLKALNKTLSKEVKMREHTPREAQKSIILLEKRIVKVIELWNKMLSANNQKDIDDACSEWSNLKQKLNKKL